MLLRDIAPLSLEVGGIETSLRPLDRDDLGRARRAYSMLSVESRMNRFWEKPRELSPSRAEALTDTDNHNHVAWVALPVDDQETPGFGGASFWRNENEPTRAEIAFTVGDPWQRSGFATLLFSILWFDGWRTGLRHFEGYCRPENTAMASWWESIGGAVEEQRRQFELHFELKAPENFVSQVGFGMPTGLRQVDVAEWMQRWLEITGEPNASA